MLRKIVCLVLPHTAPFEFGVVCEVFGVDRTATGGPGFEFHIATADPGPVPMSLGFPIHVADDLTIAADADLIAVPAHLLGTETIDERYLQVIRDAVERGAWVMSVCSGAFALAHAGVLDGRRATTHWMYTDALARRFPDIDVDPDVLFVQDGKVVTSAGTAAGIDAALHIVRVEHGAAATNFIARRMVVPPQRDGGQSQYLPSPVPERRADSFAEVTEWMLQNLDQDLTVDQLARKALMSSRTFARRFRADLGTTPAAWLNRQRILRAQQLLEQSDAGLEQVAQLAGFGTAAVMRHHFLKVMQTTPTAYRRTFSCRDDDARAG